VDWIGLVDVLSNKLIQDAQPYDLLAAPRSPHGLRLDIAHDGSWSLMLAVDYPRVLVALSAWMSDTFCDDRAVVGKVARQRAIFRGFEGLGLAFM